MLILAKIVNAVLAFIAFGVLRVVTADLGAAAWAVSLVVAIIFFYILRAMFVSPLLKRAANKASHTIIEHFAGGGDMSGAVRIAKGLGLGAKEAQAVAEVHKDALMQALIKRVFEEAREKYEQCKDKEAIRRYFREKGLPEGEIDKAVERIVKEVR